MKRLEKLVVAAVWACATLYGAMPAGAQVLGDDTNGYPIIYRGLPNDLVPDATYHIRTDCSFDSSVTDAVLTVYRSKQASTNLIESLDGAVWCTDDATFGCGAGNLQAACVSYKYDGGGTPALLLRGRSDDSYGKTRLWIRSDDDPNYDSGPGQWTDLTESLGYPNGRDYHFGGAGGSDATPAETNLAAGSPLHVHTALQPGGETGHRILAVKPDENQWKVVYKADYNGRVGFTAMIDEASVEATADLDGDGLINELAGRTRYIFGTPFYVTPPSNPQQRSLVRLLQNSTWGNNDQDGDGLGTALEYAIGTCERWYQQVTRADGSKFYCSTLPGCSGNEDPDLCTRSLRDTDGDGLRDDLEVFGYEDPSNDLAAEALMALPLWGASPTHFDVFVEIDAKDQDHDPSNGWQGFGETRPVEQLSCPVSAATCTGPDLDFFNSMQHGYSWFPAELNPDGVPGISLHFDVGISNPDAFSSLWGDWGGGNDSVPDSVDSSTIAYLSPIRSKTFVAAIDNTYAGGVGGGGKYYAGSVTGHLHELGHALGLNHTGPNGSLIGSGTFPSANNRPNFVSLMNYGFFGGFDVASNPPYSSGVVGLYAPRAVSEDCPFPSMSSSLGNPAAWPDTCVGGSPACPTNQPGCLSFDWNLDGDFDDGVVQDLTFARAQEGARYWYDRTATVVRYSGTSSAIVNGSLIYGDIEQTGSDHSLALIADSDADCEAAALPSFLQEANNQHEIVRSGGALPGCIQARSQRIYVDDLSSAAIADASCAREDSLLVVGADPAGGGGTLRAIKLAISPNAETTQSWATETGSSARTLAVAISDAQGQREIALERVHEGGSFAAQGEHVAVWMNSAGALQQTTISSTCRGDPSIAAPTPTLDTRGNPLSLVSAVQLVAFDADGDGSAQLLLLGWRNSAPNPGDFDLVVYEMDPSTGRWAFVSSAKTGVSILTSLPYRPAATVAPAIQGLGDRLWIYYPERDAVGHREYVRIANSEDAVSWSFDILNINSGLAVLGGALSATYDARSVAVGADGIRLSGHSACDLQYCSTNADCESGDCNPTTGICVWRDPCSTNADCPGASTCANDGFCNYIDNVVEGHTAGSPQCRMDVRPFARGAAPLVLPDYDEWEGVRLAACHDLESQAAGDVLAPSSLSTVPYHGAERCWPLNAHPEVCWLGGEYQYCCWDENNDAFQGVAGELCSN